VNLTVRLIKCGIHRDSFTSPLPLPSLLLSHLRMCVVEYEFGKDNRYLQTGNRQKSMDFFLI